MKIDKFTKIVLAIIAVNLTILTIKNLNIIPKAYANGSSGVELVDTKVNYGLVPLNEDGSIDVNLKSSDDVIDVNVSIDKVGDYFIRTGGIPVEMK